VRVYVGWNLSFLLHEGTPPRPTHTPTPRFFIAHLKSILFVTHAAADRSNRPVLLFQFNVTNPVISRISAIATCRPVRRSRL
jgi:hypothetical protein